MVVEDRMIFTKLIEGSLKNEQSLSKKYSTHV